MKSSEVNSKEKLKNKSINITLNVQALSHACIINAPTIWVTSSFAPDWFRDAIHEAQNGKDHNSIRREIIFAVSFAESYLVEWVRDQILNKDFKKINKYFPPGQKKGVVDKWKDIPQQLYKDKLISGIPPLDDNFWAEWSKLVNYRNGLIHASSSRPESSGLSKGEKPTPSLAILKKIPAGWPTQVVVNLIKQFHNAANLPLPNWMYDR